MVQVVRRFLRRELRRRLVAGLPLVRVRVLRRAGRGEGLAPGVEAVVVRDRFAGVGELRHVLDAAGVVEPALRLPLLADVAGVFLRHVRVVGLDRPHVVPLLQQVVAVVDELLRGDAVVLRDPMAVGIVDRRDDLAGGMLDLHQAVFVVPGIGGDVPRGSFQRPAVAVGEQPTRWRVNRVK